MPSKLPIRIDSLKDYPIVMIASGLDHGLALSGKLLLIKWYIEIIIEKKKDKYGAGVGE